MTMTATADHPWIAQYPTGVPATIGTDAPLSMPGLLDRAADRFGDRPAMSCGATSWTYDEMRALVHRAAAGLSKLGIREGDRVCVLSPNHPAIPIWFFGALSIGAIVVSLSPLSAQPALEQSVSDSGARVLLTIDSEEFRARAGLLAARTGLERVVVASLTGGELKDRPAAGQAPDEEAAFLTLEMLLANDGAFAAPSLDPRESVAVLQYTGGTTGVPKGAMLTHANLTRDGSQIRSWFPFLEDGRERVLIPLPFFHIVGITVIMTLSVHLGAEMIIVPRFTPADVLALLKEKRPTLFGGVPTVFTALIGMPEMGPEHWDSVRCILCGGAPLHDEIMRRFERLSGCKVRQIYGATETSSAATIMPANADEPRTSVGLPLPGTWIEIRSVADPLERMPPNERGEIVIDGPQIMKGYWKRETEKAQFFVGEFFRTGDIGYLDEQGYLFVVDRLKDMLIVSGFNVYPATIESAIYTHPAVAEALVIGVADDYRGEAAKAFVVLKPGAELSLDALQGHLADRLSSAEMPRHLEIRAELPKTAVGKLSRLELRRQLDRPMVTA